MPNIKVILYDADGVLINAYMAFSQVLNRDYGISVEDTTSFFKGPFVDCLNGNKDMRDVLPEYLKEWGWKGTLNSFLKLWFTTEHSIEKALIEHVDVLREQGIRCYVATNQEKHRAKYMLEDMSFKDHFDGLYASAHLGAKKPDFEFFNKILKELKVSPAEVLFWDDSAGHIKAASEVGMNAEHYKSLIDYKNTMLHKYGL